MEKRKESDDSRCLVSWPAGLKQETEEGKKEKDVLSLFSFLFFFGLMSFTAHHRLSDAEAKVCGNFL